jgi:hypothetical protein
MRSERPAAGPSGLLLPTDVLLSAKCEQSGLDQANDPVDRSRAGATVKPHKLILLTLGPGLAAKRERPFVHSVSMSCASHLDIPFLFRPDPRILLDLVPS